MNPKDKIDQIEKLQREIALLPLGSISIKNINGKDYYYQRISSVGKRTKTYNNFPTYTATRENVD